MPLYPTPDGRYIHAITTANEGDGNDVVYDRDAPGGPWPWPGKAVWDRFSYEAGLGEVRPPVAPTPDLPSPVPAPGPLPEPSTPADWPRGLKVIPVTDASDGDFVPRMYSYWSNAWVTGHWAYVFAGHTDGLPRFFKVDISSGSVERLGPLIGWTGTTEGWYWDADSWIYLTDGARLMRVNPFTNEARVVFDISDSHPGCVLWQAHSSDDGRVHSATVLRVMADGSTYPRIETVVYHDGRVDPYPAHGTLDESQVDASGEYVIIKETLDDGLSNRVIGVRSRETRLIRKSEGALGHSDVGPGYMVGEWSHENHGECVYWDLRALLVPERRRYLFQTWNLGHLSIRGGRCLHSDDTHLSLVSMESGVQIQLLAHSGDRPQPNDPNAYDFQVKANLDPSGRVATYMIHRNGRYEILLAVLPA